MIALFDIVNAPNAHCKGSEVTAAAASQQAMVTAVFYTASE